MRLLVTRPEPDAQRTAAALRARGHAVFVAPLLRIEAIAEADPGPGPWDAVLITSANAADVIGRHRRMAELGAVPLFAVGRRSADAARVAGFAQVTSADGDVHALAELIRARISRGAALLYLAGEDRSGDLAGALAQFAVRTIAIYRAIPSPSPPWVDGLDAVLHYSRRTAQAYLDAAAAAARRREALALVHFCLSAQVAEPLAAAGATDIRIAARPDESVLLELLGSA